jgi:hypothetical protein
LIDALLETWRGKRAAALHKASILGVLGKVTSALFSLFHGYASVCGFVRRSRVLVQPGRLCSVRVLIAYIYFPAHLLSKDYSNET